MSTRNFFQSVTHALHGIGYVFRHEQNFRIQVVISIVVFVFSWLFPLTGSERIAMVLLIVFVLVLELVNSAIEKFTDIVKPRLHEQVGIVKDIMAGTVLISSLGAIIWGLVIFLPYIIELFVL
jgi:diacylglycerol kinase